MTIEIKRNRAMVSMLTRGGAHVMKAFEDVTFITSTLRDVLVGLRTRQHAEPSADAQSPGA